MKNILIIVLVFVITACSSSETAVQTAINQTQSALPTSTPQPSETPTPIPTPTPTKIPLDALDLEPLIIQEGDMPAGYHAAQVRFDLPGMFDDIPEPINSIYQQFEHDGESAGGVAVMIYDSSDIADNAYYLILTGMGMESTNSYSGLGERAHVASVAMTLSGITFKNLEVLFLRCTTVIHIRMTDTDNIDYGIGYAQRLDSRLTNLICP